MAIFRCKSCGGDLDVQDGVTVIECEYCGNKQTLPKVTDENLQALFNRANFLRQKCDFDKAEKLYEKILEQDDREAEAYWGIILCKFGIEYVKDPGTENMIPTCHRVSYDSIVADDYYKQALKNADAVQKPVYEAEAKKIDEIQKQILEISRKEKPYDVFICYKETDENGQRTHDSVMANDIYHQLTQEGFKVFYAAITLEGKLGSDYEAVIFAALNSSKVMLAVGSKPEYFQATWVRNEWSRYLRIMKKDRSRLLIPCYSGMDAYDLPEEFAHLQAQDMSKIGFINDLVRGIKKVIVKDEPQKEPTVVSAASTSNVAPLLKRAFMFLEDGDFDRADDLCEQVLNQDPENAMAYVAKLMGALGVRKMTDLANCSVTFENEINYKKAIRFGDEALKESLKGYNDGIRARNSAAKRESIYQEATALAINHNGSPENLRRASSLFDTIKDYKDSEQRAKDCLENANAVVYDKAFKLMKAGGVAKNYLDAKLLFSSIGGYRDSDALANECVTLAKDADYNAAVAKMNSAKQILEYEAAAKLLLALNGYRDSKQKAEECRVIIKNIQNEGAYQVAISEMNSAYTVESIEKAKKRFEVLGDYKDSKALAEECSRKESALILNQAKRIRAQKRKKTVKRLIIVGIIAAIIGIIAFSVYRSNAANKAVYDEAKALIESEEYEQALEKLESLDSSYEDVYKLLGETRKNIVVKLFKEGKITEAEELWVKYDEENYGWNDTYAPEIRYNQAAAYANAGDYEKAYEIYRKDTEYEDTELKIKALRITARDKALALYDEGKYEEAYDAIRVFEYSEEEFDPATRKIISCLADGNYAGAAEAGLTHITLPNDITEIKNNAFQDCEKLEGITLPNTLTKIGSNAFNGCKNLKAIVIPESVTQIGAGAFIGCEALKTVKIPSQVTVLTDSVFEGCKGLTAMVIPTTVTEIQLDAFRGCESLTEMVVPDSVTVMGTNVFYGCKSLKSLTLPFIGAKADGTGSRSFVHICSDIPASLKEVTVTKGTTIYASAFKNYKHLVTLNLPNTITSIGASAFEGCNSLSNITIPSGVKTIGDNAFLYCTSLLSINIPASLTGIGNKAFENCYKLVEIYNLSNLNMTMGADTQGYIAKYAKAIHKSASAQSILFREGDYVFMNDGGAISLLTYTGTDTILSLPASANGSNYSIADHAFIYNPSITKITLPAGVTAIGSKAFNDCSMLEEIDMSASKVTSIGAYAFYSCEKLETVTFSSVLKSIGLEAFYHCKLLKNIAIPVTLISIEKNAFGGDTDLSSVMFDINGRTGWWYSNNVDAVSGTAISADDLSNSITAATKLDYNLAGYYWKRTVS